jgi:hypothetical protein
MVQSVHRDGCNPQRQLAILDAVIRRPPENLGLENLFPFTSFEPRLIEDADWVGITGLGSSLR